MDKHLDSALKRGHEFAQSLLKGIADEQMAAQPVPGQIINPPAWIVGHLCLSNDFGTTLLGGKGVSPAAWRPLFGPGVKPQTDRAAYPSKAELVAKLDESFDTFLGHLSRATPEQLDAPAPDFLRARFPTIGAFAYFDISTHYGTHLGQLSAWRRALGLPPLF